VSPRARLEGYRRAQAADCNTGIQKPRKLLLLQTPPASLRLQACTKIM
jgi:hypothetical protein